MILTKCPKCRGNLVVNISGKRLHDLFWTKSVKINCNACNFQLDSSDFGIDKEYKINVDDKKIKELCGTERDRE